MVKGRERTTKFYFQNEKEVMTELGFMPTKGSGSSWIEKEDGENDFLLAQLKSTDKQSYKLNQLDIEKLEYNAYTAHKIPMFIIQFLNNDSRYALVAIEDIPKISEYIKTGDMEKPPEGPQFIPDDQPKKKPVNTVKSSKNARDKFYDKKQKVWEEKKWQKK